MASSSVLPLLVGERACVRTRRAARRTLAAADCAGRAPPPQPPLVSSQPQLLPRRGALCASLAALCAALTPAPPARAGALDDAAAALVLNAARSRAAATAPEAATAVAAPSAAPLGRDIQESPDGLAWVDLRVGDGPLPRTGDLVVAHVKGFLPDGTVFEDTASAGTPLVFTAGIAPRGVCDGLERGLLTTRAGGTRLLSVPASLAFGGIGAVGSLHYIPPNTPLRYELELLRCGPGGVDGVACCTQPEWPCAAPASFSPAAAAAEDAPPVLGRAPTVDEMVGLE
jgi:FKBP-type peptidyl-prolyl cis-trans isomerase